MKNNHKHIDTVTHEELENATQGVETRFFIYSVMTGCALFAGLILGLLFS